MHACLAFLPEKRPKDTLHAILYMHLRALDSLGVPTPSARRVTFTFCILLRAFLQNLFGRGKINARIVKDTRESLRKQAIFSIFSGFFESLAVFSKIIAVFESFFTKYIAILMNICYNYRMD